MGSLGKLFRSRRIYLQLFIEKRRCYVIDINGWRTHSIYHCVKTGKRQEANLEKMTESKLHKQFLAWMSSLAEKLFLWLFRLWINNDKKRIVYCFWICVVMKVNIVWRGFIYWKNNQKNSMIMFCSTCFTNNLCNNESFDTKLMARFDMIRTALKITFHFY